MWSNLESYYNLEGIYIEQDIKEIFKKLRIDTEFLVIRRIQNKDKFDLFEIMNDKETGFDDGFSPYCAMDEEYEAFFEYLTSDETRYAIELKDNQKVIGIINLTDKPERAVTCYELGYDINPQYRRKGYATVAIKAIIDYCFNIVNIDLLTACVFDWNIKSSNMLKKLGFIEEGKVYKAAYHFKLGPVDLISFYKEK